VCEQAGFAGNSGALRVARRHRLRGTNFHAVERAIAYNTIDSYTKEKADPPFKQQTRRSSTQLQLPEDEANSKETIQ
jgi:hypothetical protein